MFSLKRRHFNWNLALLSKQLTSTGMLTYGAYQKAFKL